ncbi:MAG: transcriptional repressor [Oscillospiraceae bacterium]|nr:transcriptional repressor [Oscillospiraceae bacterium]
MPNVYQTKQKGIILTYLSEHAEQAFSAREILLSCKQKGTPVGLATIYRHLECLVRENKVKKVTTDNSAGLRYQFLSPAARGDAFFLKCDCCGKITSAECGLLDEMATHMNRAHGFKLDTARSVLYGRCRECL